MSELKGHRALAAHYNRSRATVREWDCPKKKIDGVYHFDTDEVDHWLATQTVVSMNDDDPADNSSVEMQFARLRKLNLESDRLQREKELAEGLYAPIDDLEKYAVKAISQIKQMMTENFTELLDLSDLAPADKEKLQAKLIDGFNKIAEFEILDE